MFGFNIIHKCQPVCIVINLLTCRIKFEHIVQQKQAGYTDCNDSGTWIWLYSVKLEKVASTTVSEDPIKWIDGSMNIIVERMIKIKRFRKILYTQLINYKLVDVKIEAHRK